MEKKLYTNRGTFSAFAFHLGVVKEKANKENPLIYKELFMNCGTYFVGYSFGDRLNDYKKEGFSTLKEAKKLFNSIKI